MKCFFVLGNHPSLSRAEIESVTRRLKINGHIAAAESSFLLFETEQTLDAAKLIATLGGTIKIGQVLGAIDELNAAALEKFIPALDNKIIFGISNYNLRFDIQKVGLGLKRIIKNQGGSARFVTSKEYPLSSVIVQKEILNKGIELVIMKTGGQLYVGTTLVVQPFELFSKLDYGRPNSDAKSGMLPPKLAQIMVNLAEQPLNATILDPFCGSGTILQQAIMLGYTNVCGSDSSTRAVEDSSTNLDWLKQQTGARFNGDVKQLAVKSLPKAFALHSINAIVTEPYLGPALRGVESFDQLNKTAAALRVLYQEALTAMVAVLKPNGAIVIVIPEFSSNGQAVTIPLKQILPPNLKILGHWRYARPEQKIIRNIYKLIMK